MAYADELVGLSCGPDIVVVHRPWVPVVHPGWVSWHLMLIEKEYSASI